MTEPLQRRSSDSTWFRILDRFGLPTLLAIVLLGYVLRNGEADREERRQLLSGIKAAIEEQTKVLSRLAIAEEEHAQAVRLTWPQLRVPRRVEGER